MVQNAKTLIDQWATPLIAVCGAVTCINFVGLAIAFILIAGQAGEGADARDRQQAVFPVSEKLYMDAAERRVITARDLACFRTGANCPPRQRTP